MGTGYPCAGGGMTATSSERNKVFISYSHKDDTWLKRLHVHLKPLERSGVLDRWDDTRIGAGTDWREEILAALARARIAVLLVSANFLASDFIDQEELPILLHHAESGGAQILPVLVSPCMLPAHLSRFQAINRPERTLSEMTEAEQDRVWMQLRSTIETSLEKLDSPPSKRVFASCCSEDLAAADVLVRALAAQGLDVTLESWTPGEEESAALSFVERIEESQAVLLLIGSRGLGPWTQANANDALENSKRTRRQILSVFLPGAPDSLADQMPSFLPRNTWIKLVRGIADEVTLGRIHLGLTGAKPESPRPFPPAPPAGQAAVRPAPKDPVEAVLKKLGSLAVSRNLTILLGKHAAPPPPAELARLLLVSLELIEPGSGFWVPPLDVVGSYYAAGAGEDSLEVEINGMIGGRSQELPPVHGLVAELLELLEQRSPDHDRLIVTSGFDLLLERALLRAGVAFTRVVQHRTAHRIEVNEYQQVELTTKGEIRISHQSYKASLVPADDTEALDREITGFARRLFDRSKDPGYDLPLNELKGPILYKFQGSQDVENSCAISADQHLQLSRKLLPSRVTGHITGGPVMVLGHGIFDPDFRLVCNMLLPDWEQANRYAALPSPALEGDDDRRIEAKLWDSIKIWTVKQFGIEIVERSSEELLRRLISRLKGPGA